MAIEDIVRKQQYIEVYPLSTRKITVGYGGPYVNTNDGDEGLWPPDLNSGGGHEIFYADEVEGFGADDPDNVHQYGNTFWSDDQQIFGIAKRVRPSIREAFHPILYFDLGGLPPGRWARIELVCHLYSFYEYDEDGRSIVADYYDRITPYSAGLGERPSPPDFTIADPGRSVIPELTVNEIAVSREEGTRVRYPDPYSPVEGDENYRWALPLRDDGRFTPGRLRGLRLLMTGGEPAGYNLVNGDCRYDLYDDYLAAGQTVDALYNLPHLRFWPGGVDAEADVTLDLTLEGQVEGPPRRLIEHQARQRRGW